MTPFSPSQECLELKSALLPIRTQDVDTSREQVAGDSGQDIANMDGVNQSQARHLATCSSCQELLKARTEVAEQLGLLPRRTGLGRPGLATFQAAKAAVDSRSEQSLHAAERQLRPWFAQLTGQQPSKDLWHRVATEAGIQGLAGEREWMPEVSDRRVVRLSRTSGLARLVALAAAVLVVAAIRGAGSSSDDYQEMARKTDGPALEVIWTGEDSLPSAVREQLRTAGDLR